MDLWLDSCYPHTHAHACAPTRMDTNIQSTQTTLRRALEIVVLIVVAAQLDRQELAQLLVRHQRHKASLQCDRLVLWQILV